MNANKILLIVGVITAVALAAILAAFFLNRPATLETQTDSTATPPTQSSASSETSAAPASSESSGITLSEVATHTGRDGNSCWVAVDDTVYEIGGFVLWADGLHSPSGGRARCGKDLSSVIGQSPHGKSKLKLLKEIGPLQK